jgi:hypothetical protein
VWLLLLVTSNVVLSTMILVTLMTEEICSFDTSLLTRATRHNIPEDGIFHSHRRQYLRLYIAFNRLGSVAERFPVRYELLIYIPK